MFENLSGRLSGVLDNLTRQGVLTDEDVSAALREVRLALLEADVSLPVVKSFVRSVQRKATGQSVMRSVAPGNQVIKIVHDELISVLAGSEGEDGSLKIANPPAPVLMVGLQGSGKTTTTAKVAKRLAESDGKRVLMASLDTRRPAAMEQLDVLGRQAGIETLPIIPGQSAVQIAKRAMQHSALNGFDVFFLDTAGRLHIDELMMDEILEVRDAVAPRETLLVVDGLTGQDAVNVASEFDGKVGISGVVLTRMDGDGRGGAALSMRAITGKPIKFIGTGEKLDALGTFEPERIAGRILGMGDIVSLVERAAATLEQEKSKRMMRRIQKGQFNLNDFRDQLENIEKMGGFGNITSLIPGMGKVTKAAEESAMDSNFVKRQIALINSMTRQERANPKILQASRRKRIAAGAGQEVSDLNKLLKSHRVMADVTKKISKGGFKGAMASLLGRTPGAGEMAAMSQATDPGGGMHQELQNLRALGNQAGSVPKFPFGGRR